MLQRALEGRKEGVNMANEIFGAGVPPVRTIGGIMEDIGRMPVCPVSGEVNLYYIILRHK